MQEKIRTEYNENNAKNVKMKFRKTLKDAFTYNTGTKKRIWELDILRGILMIFVTLDHCCSFGLAFGVFDFQTQFGMMLHDAIQIYRDSAFRAAVQPPGLFLFCYLSGINCSFSKSKFRRVLKMGIICGLFMGVYALLHCLVPELCHCYFMFNIIAVITICVAVWWFLDAIKCPTWIRVVLAIAIICIGQTYYYMYFIRGSSYINNDFMALLVYNSHGNELSQDNFEPLFPHLGWFILGGVMGKYIYKEKKTLTTHEEPYKPFIPLAYVGKHSLVVYFAATFIILGLTLGFRLLIDLII